MPAFQGSKVAFQPEMHMMHSHHPRSREMLFGRHQQMGKSHPMFEALRSNHAVDKVEYARMLRMRELKKLAGEVGYPTFDSLKLLGADNDAHYLDAFMSESGKLRHAVDDSDFRLRARSVSHTSKGSGKRNSANIDNIKKSLLGSLRSTASDENIYESVEVIQYRKQVEALNRQSKVRSVPKTGHPLFDHLRVENVLKPRRQHHHRRNETHNSDGGSNSHSSSGSGDEFDYARKPNCRFSRREVLMAGSQQPKKQKQQQQQLLQHQEEARHQKHSTRHVPEAGSESDDDWAIPRPKICGGAVGGAVGGGRNRRTGATGLMNSISHEESDSSSKSTGLR